MRTSSISHFCYQCRNSAKHLKDATVELAQKICLFIKELFASLSHFFAKNSQHNKGGFIHTTQLPAPSSQSSSHRLVPPPLKQGKGPGVTPNANGLLKKTPIWEKRALVDLDPVDKAVYTSVAINRSRIKDAPRPIDFQALKILVERATPPVAKKELLEHFDHLFSDIRDEEMVLNDEGIDRSKEDCKDQLKLAIINFNDSPNYQAYVALVGDNFNLLVKAISFYLRPSADPSLEEDPSTLSKKKEALKTIISASFHCPPRRYAACDKTYLLLSDQIEDLDQILLQMVQTLKEDMFTNYYNASKEPVQTLNLIRREAGADLGLNRDPIHINDPHIDRADFSRREVMINFTGTPYITTVEDFKWYSSDVKERLKKDFFSFFTPENFMNGMKISLNTRIAQDNSFATELSLYINNLVNKLVEEGKLSPNDLETLPMPYQYDPFEHKEKGYQLTDLGLRLLLLDFRFLNAL